MAIRGTLPILPSESNVLRLIQQEAKGNLAFALRTILAGKDLYYVKGYRLGWKTGEVPGVLSTSQATSQLLQGFPLKSWSDPEALCFVSFVPYVETHVLFWFPIIKTVWPFPVGQTKPRATFFRGRVLLNFLF